MIEADEACDKAAAELEKGREARSNKMAAKQRETFARRRAERADAWTEQLAIQVSVCACMTILQQARLLHKICRRGAFLFCKNTCKVT